MFTLAHRHPAFFRPGPSLPTLLTRASAKARTHWLSSAGLAIGLLLSSPGIAASDKVRITSLSDVAFGTIANLSADASLSQSICLFANTTTNGYTVTANGAGPTGEFALASPTASMPYEVQWNSSAGQSAGTPLTANVPLTGQVSAASHQTCNNGPASSASLVVILRSAALSSAAAGTYNGTLTLLIGPE